MAFNEDTKYVISKLNNSNYQLWKFKLKKLLGGDGFWQVTKGASGRLGQVGIKGTSGHRFSSRRWPASARNMWLTLQLLHEQANVSSKLFLPRRILEMWLKEGQSMQNHITALLEIVEQLRGIGEQMKESYIGAMLLWHIGHSSKSPTRRLSHHWLRSWKAYRRVQGEKRKRTRF